MSSPNKYNNSTTFFQAFEHTQTLFSIYLRLSPALYKQKRQGFILLARMTETSVALSNCTLLLLIHVLVFHLWKMLSVRLTHMLSCKQCIVHCLWKQFASRVTSVFYEWFSILLPTWYWMSEDKRTWSILATGRICMDQPLRDCFRMLYSLLSIDDGGLCISRASLEVCVSVCVPVHSVYTIMCMCVTNKGCFALIFLSLNYVSPEGYFLQTSKYTLWGRLS